MQSPSGCRCPADVYKRQPVNYDPKAATPDRWLTFLHELLDDADIPTLQEYLGYCLIPSTCLLYTSQYTSNLLLLIGAFA